MSFKVFLYVKVWATPDHAVNLCVCRGNKVACLNSSPRPVVAKKFYCCVLRI